MSFWQSFLDTYNKNHLKVLWTILVINLLISLNLIFYFSLNPTIPIMAIISAIIMININIKLRRRNIIDKVTVYLTNYLNGLSIVIWTYITLILTQKPHGGPTLLSYFDGLGIVAILVYAIIILFITNATNTIECSYLILKYKKIVKNQ